MSALEYRHEPYRGWQVPLPPYFGNGSAYASLSSQKASTDSAGPDCGPVVHFSISYILDIRDSDSTRPPYPISRRCLRNPNAVREPEPPTSHSLSEDRDGRPPPSYAYSYSFFMRARSDKYSSTRVQRADLKQVVTQKLKWEVGMGRAEWTAVMVGG